MRLVPAAVPIQGRPDNRETGRKKDSIAEPAAIQRSHLVAVLLVFYWGLNGLTEKTRFLAEVHGDEHKYPNNHVYTS